MQKQVKKYYQQVKKPQLIWQIHIVLTLMINILRCKDYNKWVTTRDNDNVQSHDQEESKLNSTINANCGAHTLLSHDKVIKCLFHKNNVATIKSS